MWTISDAWAVFIFFLLLLFSFFLLFSFYHSLQEDFSVSNSENTLCSLLSNILSLVASLKNRFVQLMPWGGMFCHMKRPWGSEEAGWSSELPRASSICLGTSNWCWQQGFWWPGQRKGLLFIKVTVTLLQPSILFLLETKTMLLPDQQDFTERDRSGDSSQFCSQIIFFIQCFN